MPRSAGIQTPKYRRHKATGQAIVTIAGRDCYLGPHGTKASLVEYDRLVGEWLAAGRPTRQVVGTNDCTVAELVAAYRKYAKGHYTVGGTLANIGTAMRALRRTYGHTLAAEFGPLALKALRQKFVDQGLRRGYCNRLTDLVRRAFKWAAADELIPQATWQALTAVDGLRRGHTEARETEPIGPVDDSIVEATLPFLPDAVGDLVRLQRLTGARPAEICALRPADIDRTGKVWRFEPGEHKNAHRGKRRVIHIGPRGQQILRRYLFRAADAFCFVPSEVVAAQRAKRHAARKTPLSCGNRPGANRRGKPRRTPGECYDVNAYRRAIHRACDAADRQAHKDNPDVPADERIVPRWSPNRLRHAAATEIRKLFDIEAAQVVLGHAKPDITTVYAERDLERAARVMHEVG